MIRLSTAILRFPKGGIKLFERFERLWREAAYGMIRFMSRESARVLIAGFASLLIVLALGGRAEAGSDTTLALARSLAASDDHAQAALEFRRLALNTAGRAEQGSYYWMAGYEYGRAGRFDQAEKMMDQAEDAAPSMETEIYLLRGENNRRRGRPREAAFYLESLVSSNRPAAVRSAAARQLTAVRLQTRDFAGARQALSAAPVPPEKGMAAIAAYEKGRDKSPAVGGLLGLIPGLGYAYSGEYANASRSLLLNALCIWGIVSFAEDETWGGVAVVGFAEITFYTGSVYGGADAAFRYNRERLESSTRVIEERAGFRPDLSALPLLSLRFEF